MLDFLRIKEVHSKKGIVIRPAFRCGVESNDLMIRAGDFYAIWLEDKGVWSTKEIDAINAIDRELYRYRDEHYPGASEELVVVEDLDDSSTGQIEKWHSFCQRSLRDRYEDLDACLVFAGEENTKEKYSTKHLPYAVAHGPHDNWDELVGQLYDESNKHKIEWAIGCILSGDSKTIQKFLVLYGSAGTGKSTILRIIEQLFEGYVGSFDAQALGNPNNSFALEPLKKNPIVAIQDDGDLSKIQDNTRLNSIISHEEMPVNTKYGKIFPMTFRSFLIIGTNKEVKITDAKSGLLRRLIDVYVTGNTFPKSKYNKLMRGVKYELGAIAAHCLDVYNEDPGFYDDYIPKEMMFKSNDFLNFIEAQYCIYEKDNYTTLSTAWDQYKVYCADSNTNPKMKYLFKDELRNYFEEYHERYSMDGRQMKNVFVGFKKTMFEATPEKKKESSSDASELIFKEERSILDDILKDCKAQYAVDDRPATAWSNCKTTLKDIDTSKLHYVLPRTSEGTHVFIDFDIPDENGNKCFDKNYEAAKKWPLTYAEVSKSGQGIHLHYIYKGDPSELSNVYDDHIEIKAFQESSLVSMRRKVSKVFNHDITVLTGGLPVKEKKVINFKTVKDEEHLRNIIKKFIKKEAEDVTSTHQSMSLIKKTLDDAYESGIPYDISDMYNALFSFACSSTNQSDACLKMLGTIKLKSQEESASIVTSGKNVFFDCEVFPNLFLINWKFEGPDEPVVRMINPTPEEVDELIKLNLIGFNNLRYDNYMLYARHLGYTNEQLFTLSNDIINGDRKDIGMREAKNISKTDIYDFSSKKQSLKLFEIDMHFPHKELGIPWDQPVPEDRWAEVAAYCDNDVLATEALFNTPERQADYLGRQILADIAGLTVNDSTNACTTRIIFGAERHPSGLQWRDLGDVSDATDIVIKDNVMYSFSDIDEYVKFDTKGRPVFPGYTFSYDSTKKKAVSMYRGEEVGEGGYVYAEPGMYGNVALLDVKSMHPSSIVAENLFGDYTKNFKDIKDARVAVKEKRYSDARNMLDGKLSKYIDKVESGELSNKQLAGALKIAINSVYGLTAAKFDNPFRDYRNTDNIVAKRGALFMVNLKNAVQAKGFKVAHIKTDSIKIPDATPEIIEFVMDFGKAYGYEFDHEATYDRMCLVNNAVYIAKYKDDECHDIVINGEVINTPWTATGAEFAVPYIFKTLFAKKPLNFYDFTVTNSVAGGAAIYIGDDKNEEYTFVGRVGSFCPMAERGGTLWRGSIDKNTGKMKYSALSGTKGYKFLESETVQSCGYEEFIDKNYFITMANNAIEDIKLFGDYDWFVSDQPYESPTFTDGKPLYFD